MFGAFLNHSQSLLFLNIFHCCYMCAWCVCGQVYMDNFVVGLFLPLLHGFQGSNTDHQISRRVPLPTKPFCRPSTLISETKFLAGPGLHQFGWIGWVVRPCPCLCLPSVGLIATCHCTWPFSVCSGDWTRVFGLTSQVLSWLSHLFHTQNSSYLFIISLTVSVPIEYYLRQGKVSLF